jgi:hypothetical protein
MELRLARRAVAGFRFASGMAASRIGSNAASSTGMNRLWVRVNGAALRCYSAS